MWAKNCSSNHIIAININLHSGNTWGNAEYFLNHQQNKTTKGRCLKLFCHIEHRQIIFNKPDELLIMLLASRDSDFVCFNQWGHWIFYNKSIRGLGTHKVIVLDRLQSEFLVWFFRAFGRKIWLIQHLRMTNYFALLLKGNVLNTSHLH